MNLRDYLELGSAPGDEECVRVGHPDYFTKARNECNKFIELLRKKFGPEPAGASLGIRHFSHDFGTYMEVVCHYDTGIPESYKYALTLEHHLPGKWSEDASTPWRDLWKEDNNAPA